MKIFLIKLPLYRQRQLRNKDMEKIFYGILLMITGLLFPLTSSADMSSTNYTIFADSVGALGGFATSADYSLEGSVSVSPQGVATSSSYVLRGGFLASDQGELAVSLSSSNINLGALSASQVNTASVVVTVTSSAATGYTLAVGSVSGSMPSPVTDLSVTAGVEEYGMAVSGADQVISGDAAIVPGLILASSSTPATATQTTLTFKASKSSNSTAGTYNQNIALTLSANF